MELKARTQPESYIVFREREIYFSLRMNRDYLQENRALKSSQNR